MKNWRTTIIGALLAGATAVSIYQSNGGKLEDWTLWVMPAVLQMLGFLAKDAWITGAAKALAVSFLCLGLASCAVRPDGTKTFGGLDGGQWGSVALGAVTSAGGSYMKARKEPVLVIPPGGKTPVLVEPKSAEPGWLEWGFGLLGL